MHRTLFFLLLSVVFLGPSWEAEATAEYPESKPKRHCPTGLYWRPLTRQCARDELTSERPSPAGYTRIKKKKFTRIIWVCPAGTYWVPRKKKCKRVSALPGGNSVRCHYKKKWDPKKRACVDVLVQQVGYETNTAAPEPMGESGLDSGAEPIDSDPIGAMGSGVGSEAHPPEAHLTGDNPIGAMDSGVGSGAEAMGSGVGSGVGSGAEPIAPDPIATRPEPGFFQKIKKVIWGHY